jgi:hypothetical protein
MRSKLLVCAAAIAVYLAAGLSSRYVSVAHAAGANGKKKDAAASADAKKPAELHADDKSMKRQTQWEDKVMGPDSTRAELDKIARARAVNEKAEREKERQAALEPATPAPKAAPAKASKSEVSLLSPDAEKSDAKAHEISPKLDTEAAKAPVPAAKRGDDKFIDKLLRDEGAPGNGKAKRASSGNDKELDALLAGVKDQPGANGKRKRGDSVDDLLKTADKGPAMPAPRAQSGGLPEWAKVPEIAPTPPPAPPPVAVKVAPKKPDSGVIQVVQGAAGNAPAVVTPNKPAASAPVAARGSRKTPAKAAAAPVAWSDPFADKKPVAAAQSPKKEPASRPSASASSDTTWNDPFAEPDEPRKTVRHTTQAPPSPAAPTSPAKRNDKAEPSARPAGWKDPFTKATPPTPAPARASVAMRDLGKNESSKWEIAARRPAARSTPSEARSTGGWAVLKKHAR